MKNNNIVQYGFGLSLQIVPGLYLVDLFLFLSLLLKRRPIFSRQFLIVLLISLSYIIGCIIIIAKGSINTATFFIPYNISYLAFIIFVLANEQVKLNLFAISLPCIISIAMFSVPVFESFLQTTFNISGSPRFGRYGGIFGRNVSALGFYASLVLLVGLLFYEDFSKRVIYISFISAFAAIILSGTRVGLLLIILLFPLYTIIFTKRLAFLIKISLVLGLTTLAIFTLLYLYFTPIFEYVLFRFSIERLVVDFTTGNATTAYNLLRSTLENRDVNFFTLFFGYGGDISYIDNIYINFVLQYGLVSLSVGVLILAWSIVFLIKQKCYKVATLVLFGILAGLKGPYLFSNHFLLLLLFAYNHEKTKNACD